MNGPVCFSRRVGNEDDEILKEDGEFGDEDKGVVKDLKGIR